MRASTVEMQLAARDLAALAGAFARPGDRPAAAQALAHTLGGHGLLILSPDPELDVLLPAPGLPQTLPHAGLWRQFIDETLRSGSARGALPVAGGAESGAAGIAADGVVAILTGPGAREAELALLRPLLPLLGALFMAERQVDVKEVEARSAREAMERARVLTSVLNDTRQRLEEALSDAQAARTEARGRAEQAELLAEELQMQAALLEEHAAELELLNDELGQRTEEAEQARREADEANRAKSEFLANMSHELRTPINAVLGYEELLTMEISGPLTGAQRTHLERIRSSSRHLLTLINDILDLAKVEAGQMTVVREFDALRPVILESMSLVQMQHEERGIELRDGCGGDSPGYWGDRDRVRQILLNLLSNAAKFTEPGGSVTIRCGSTRTPAAEAHLLARGEWAYVEVEDTGIGIDADHLTRVFQPFGQVENGRTRTQGGTGLGLTISRQLARLMGGDLTVRSQPGVGSCFSLWLPADRAIMGELDQSIRVPDL